MRTSRTTSRTPFRRVTSHHLTRPHGRSITAGRDLTHDLTHLTHALPHVLTPL